MLANTLANEQMTDEPTPTLIGSEGANNPTDDKTCLISLAGEMGKSANEQMTNNLTL